MLACSAQCRKFQDFGLWRVEMYTGEKELESTVRVQSQLYPLWPWPQASCIISLNLSFLICKIGSVCLSITWWIKVGVVCLYSDWRKERGDPLICIVFRCTGMGRPLTLLCLWRASRKALQGPSCLWSPSSPWCPLKAETPYSFVAAVTSGDTGIL